jgi:hypothetical protein
MRFAISKLLISAIICLCLILGIAVGQVPSSCPALDNIKEFNSNFVQHQQNSPMGQLELPKETIYFPWAARDNLGLKSSAGIASSCGPSKKRIHMEGASSRQQVEDLKAINSVKERDLIYDDVQRGDVRSGGQSNCMDVQVTGGADEYLSGKDHTGFEDDDVEYLVDSALTSNPNPSHSRYSASSRGRSLGNNLNIEVSGISVSAINTVEGGSAVANSNIIIKPVQIITSPREVDEKLR